MRARLFELYFQREIQGNKNFDHFIVVAVKNVYGTYKSGKRHGVCYAMHQSFQKYFICFIETLTSKDLLTSASPAQHPK